ncbi:putative ribonuclease H protein [Vitis vinifera]|uniref:Putative ribonuclease H protein n=1 Tax=Vitis vinifera TaxID=29760 RepID=A0A438H2H5_VITVI|nr:putative ribonuclease H protein [Vitis vinifera]
MRRRLAQWKRQYISKGGELFLSKALWPAYPSTFYPLYASLNLLQEGLRNPKRFLWGGGRLERKAHLIKWKVVCSPKEEGGLGIRKIEVLNKALLGKWVWRYAYEKENLWKRVIGVKYGQEGCGWRTKDGCGPYGVGLWKEIMKEADWCWESIVFKLFTLAGNRKAKVSEVWDSSLGQGGWNLRLARDFNDWELEQIGNMLNLLKDFRTSTEEDALVSSEQTHFGWIRCQQKYLFLLGKLPGGRSSPWISFKEGGGSSLTGVFCVDVKRKTNGEKQCKFLVDYMENESKGNFYDVKIVPDFAGIQRFVTGFHH